MSVEESKLRSLCILVIATLTGLASDDDLFPKLSTYWLVDWASRLAAQ